MTSTIITTKGINIINEVVEQATPSNKEIEYVRKCEYKDIANDFLFAYLQYTELGELDKAEEAYTKWLEAINKIRNDHPYIQEEITIKRTTSIIEPVVEKKEHKFIIFLKRILSFLKSKYESLFS